MADIILNVFQKSGVFLIVGPLSLLLSLCVDFFSLIEYTKIQLMKNSKPSVAIIWAHCLY